MTKIEIEPGPRPETATQETTDLRRHPRHFCIDGKVVRLAVRPEFRGRRALVFDVSVGGIGLLLEHELEAGTVLVFELHGEFGTVSRIARVRHCKQHATPPDAPWLPPAPTFSRVFRGMFGMKSPQPPGHCWLVGCEFDKPLEERENQQLKLTIVRDPVS